MFRNLTIKGRLALMAAIPLLLIALVSALGYSALQATKIRGEAYNEIILSKDLVADVLPPPEYLVESLLVAYQLADGVSSGNENQISRSSVQLKRLKRQYDARHIYWERNLTDPKLRQLLLVQSYQPAVTFFSDVENKLLPAVARINPAEVQAAVRGLVAAYEQHLKAIRQVIALANRSQQQVEADISSATQTRLALLVVAILALMAATAAIGYLTVRSITSRIARLRRVATEDLPRAIAGVRAATAAGQIAPQMQPIAFKDKDELTDAADAFNAVLSSAVGMAGEQAALRRTTSAMFVNLGRRNHKLLSRTLSYITELERTERDPATLQSLFRLDHLTTRQRRNAESLLVLAGSAPLRTWSKPVSISDVLRSALSEIESYDRVDLGQIEEVSLKGGVVSDVAHLLAELLENATNFSSPQTRVRILGRTEGPNYALVVIDEGIGMSPLDIAAANQRILSAANSDLDSSKMLGLGVVGRLAARHQIEVRLAESPAGGLAVKVSIPGGVVGATGGEGTVDLAAATPERTPAPAPEQALSTPPPAVPNDPGPQLPPSPAAAVQLPPERPPLPDIPPWETPPMAPPTWAPAAQQEPAQPPTPQPVAASRAAHRQMAARPEPAVTPMAAPLPQPLGEPMAAPLPSLESDAPLTRRVRGAQLPDTGPERELATPAPARTAESVRTALSQFSAGRATARHYALTDPVSPTEPPQEAL